MRFRDGEAAVEEPLDRLVDLVRGKLLLENANERANTLSILRDRRGERTLKLAVKEELPVLRIEADGIGWQHIDAEIRRKPQDVLAAARRNTLIAFHAVSMRVLTVIAINSDRH